MKKGNGFRSLLSLLLAFFMLFSMTSVVNAEETEYEGYGESLVMENTETVTDEIFETESAADEVFEAETETVVTMTDEPVMSAGEDVGTEEAYEVTIYEGILNGTVSTDKSMAAEGDTVTVTAAANEGYVLTQVAYREVKEDGTTGKTVEIAAADGAYTFTMPGSAVQIGAAFQPNGDYVLTNSGTSGNTLGIVGTKENNFSVYIANWDAFIKADEKESEVYLSFDKRFLDIPGVTMILESRQYGESGYTVVGRKIYSEAEIRELVKTAKVTDSEYIINSVSIPVSDGKAYIAGQSLYCVAQFGCPTWTDAFGNSLYRWNYTGVDATILEKDAAIPTPIVWLYNLDENSYRGSVVRSVLKELGVEAGTVNNDNLGQNIGYLVGWDGYEAVENPYNSGEYDVEYMLMGNLSDAQMDLLLAAMDENNIYVALKSIPTAWTASKTFVELFEIMAEESEVLQEAVALDKMIYTAESLDEQTYGDSEYWDELQRELAEALVALQTDAEETGEGADLYRNARLELEEIYLLVTGKTVLQGDLELNLEELEDGKYKVTAQLKGELKDPTFTYNWEPATSSEEAAAEYLIVTKEDLYKVSLDIEATGSFYGKMSETMHVPSNPQFTVTAKTDSIVVELEEDVAKLNTPATDGYVVELYQDGALVQSIEETSSNKIVLDGLDKETEYILKVNSYNLIGRSNIVETSVSTKGEESVAPDGTESDKDEAVTPDGTKPGEDETEASGDGEKNEADKSDEKTSENSKTKVNTVKTGDHNAILVWMILLMGSILGGYTVIKVKHRENK